MTDNTIRIIKEMTFCTDDQAQLALEKYGDVFKAIEHLLPDSGQKKRPRNDDTAIEDPEQRERCKRGRELQDKINAVFSVAHSKLKSSESAEQSEEALPVPEQSAPAAENRTE